MGWGGAFAWQLHVQAMLLKMAERMPPHATKARGSHHTRLMMLHMLNRARTPTMKNADMLVAVQVSTMSSHCSAKRRVAFRGAE